MQYLFLTYDFKNAFTFLLSYEMDPDKLALLDTLLNLLEDILLDILDSDKVFLHKHFLLENRNFCDIHS